MLDAQVKAILDELAVLSSKGPPLPLMPIADIRRGDAFFAKLCRGESPQESIGRSEDRVVAGPGGDIPIRIYWPAAGSPVGALMFFHGGGFIRGDLDSHDDLCRSLSNAAHVVIVAVAYRLAPEHQFPAAVEDCYVATEWVAMNADSLGFATDRLAVSGDSAGGNLAAVVAQLSRDRHGPCLRFQLLIYPETSASLEWPSVKEYWEPGYMAAGKGMQFFRSKYFQASQDLAKPYAFPDNAQDLKGLPPALVITAEHDPMRDMGESYAGRLREAGVPVTLSRYDGVTHVFLSMAARVDAGKKAIAEAAAAVHAALTA